MLPLDADQLYDLSEAARRLFCGPAWLARQARRQQVPWTWREGVMHFPRAWVDAAAGTTAADAEGLRAYWLERLAPPSQHAARPIRDRAALEAGPLLAEEEAARRVTADPRFLRRLAGQGVLPALRVDGSVRYDQELTDLVAAENAAERPRLAARRDAVARWARYEYAEGLDAGAAPPPTTTRPASAPSVAAAPRAWRLPDDLVAGGDDEEPERREGLAEAGGFETVDEDD